MIKLKYNSKAFLPDSYPSICILDTDIIEPELLIREIASDVSKLYPDLFAGEIPHVFYRMRYTPPYENFQDIRKLILQVRAATGIRSTFHGIMTIDVSEYKGHEDEEFFSIFLKYLYDNTHSCKTILVCSQYTEKDIEKLSGSCLKYFSVHHERINVYEKEQLHRLVKATFQKYKLKTDCGSIELISDMLYSKDLYPYRTLQLIERLPAELCSKMSVTNKKTKIISPKTIVEYFQNPLSSICMLAGHPLLPGKEEYIEQAF